MPFWSMAPWIQWLRRSWYEKLTILPFWQALGSRCLSKLGVWLRRPSMRCGNLDMWGWVGIWVQIWIELHFESQHQRRLRRHPLCLLWVSRWLAWLSQMEVLKVLRSRSTSHGVRCPRKRLTSPSVPWELPDRWVGPSPVSVFFC